MENFSFDWLELLTNLFKIGAALILALPIAWEREHSTRIMGLRTFPLVAVASCGYVLVALAVIGHGEDPQARIIQGLMSGIGFIGGGAILKEGANVRGTATAVSVWTTGAIGAAVAYSNFEVAIILSVVNFLTLRLLSPIEQKIGKGDERGKKQDDDDKE